MGEDVKRLKQCLPLFDLRGTTGRAVLQVAREFIGLCLLHAERGPSFYVNPHSTLLAGRVDQHTRPFERLPRQLKCREVSNENSSNSLTALLTDLESRSENAKRLFGVGTRQWSEEVAAALRDIPPALE
jgi:hypothetical protein